MGKRMALALGWARPSTLKLMHTAMTGPNGTVFFTGNDVATATGIREVHPTANQPGTQHLTAHAVNQVTGEVIDGAVDVPPAPAPCGH